MNTTLPLVLAAAALPALAQPIQSPEVHSDNSVTFRFQAPNAQQVFLALEGASHVAMQKGDHGLWSLTTAPLAPDIYGYGFEVDGVTLRDPNNPAVKTNLLYANSLLHVPGPASLPWELGDVPHGVVHRHFYTSAIVGDRRDFYVYTPPGYDPTARRRYPVLYLLHGYSDDASGWTAVGRAHVILDNLIAQNKAKPMLVVMPLGYGAPEFVARGIHSFDDDSLRTRNYQRFRDALIAEVLPQVEKDYRVASGRESRAIAGLSMGGAESLFTGLNALDRFAWIGAFSSGGLGGQFDALFPELDSKANSRLRLLWIACGKDDRLMDINGKLAAWLKSQDVRFTWIETPGMHTWMVWRRNLAEFAPLLFQTAP
jgi:enterochelin esterase family protein